MIEYCLSRVNGMNVASSEGKRAIVDTMLCPIRSYREINLGKKFCISIKRHDTKLDN
jgi:hypothetical protein